MKFNINAESHIDIPKHMRKIQDNDFWRFAAGEWHGLYTPYVPMDSGDLFKIVNIKPKEIEHNVPYAHRVYEGDFNFRKDNHPKASRRWDEAARPTEEPKLISAMQGYIDSGRLNLNG